MYGQDLFQVVVCYVDGRTSLCLSSALVNDQLIRKEKTMEAGWINESPPPRSHTQTVRNEYGVWQEKTTVVQEQLFRNPDNGEVRRGDTIERVTRTTLPLSKQGSQGCWLETNTATAAGTSHCGGILYFVKVLPSQFTRVV